MKYRTRKNPEIIPFLISVENAPREIATLSRVRYYGVIPDRAIAPHTYIFFGVAAELLEGEQRRLVEEFRIHGKEQPLALLHVHLQPLEENGCKGKNRLFTFEKIHSVAN
jgi:hypothetical protein